MPQRRHDTLPKSHRRAPGTSSQTGQPKRVSRKEKEAKQRKQLYWGVGIAAAVITVILIGTSINEYWIKPRHVLASVNGEDIRRRDYWKVRSLNLETEISQYSSFAQSSLISADEQQQYLAAAQQAQTELNSVWGSTSVDPDTLSQMVEDQVYLQNMDKLGVTVTDQDIDNYITQLFQPTDGALITPTPTPTLIPARADWATQTAAAAAGTYLPTLATPGAGGATPVGSPAANATPVGSPAGAAVPSGSPAEGSSLAASPAAVGTGSPSAATPVSGGSATPGGTPVAGTSPQATPEKISPTEIPTTVATPNPEQAEETVTAGYKSYKSIALKGAHMSDSDFRRLVARPAVAREKVQDVLQSQVGQTADQVHASHILVDTKDLADTIYQEVTAPGANFADIAKAQSDDTTTAPNGGDLGWFAADEMVKEFSDVVFGMQVGQISQPFQTVYGWHIVMVDDREANRPLTDAQISTIQQAVVDDWVAEQKATMDIHSEVKPTATASLQTFAPPSNAPPTPTPTEETSPEAVGSPIAGTPESGASPAANGTPETGVAVSASPAASPAGSPAASPVVAQVASPKAPPVASPRASPQPSPKASPVASPRTSPVASPSATPGGA